MFFRGYTQKQWGLDLSDLSAGVAARIPTRSNDDDRYFTDTYQMMPADGYSTMFQNMLDSSNIQVHLDTDYFSNKDLFKHDRLIYTGPIDSFYEYCYGPLPYRSLQFEHNHYADNNSFQEVGTVNYPNEEEFTRITEFKHLTGQVASGTSIVREYPRDEGDPYYPIPNPANENLFKQYQEKADQESSIFFVGRLAQYRYYNMDQVVAAALALSKKLIN
jgi:UDP-galactopyranose mutase